MSYCVNCGVELSDSAGSCPLCDTPIINPHIHNIKESKPSYPERIEIPKSSRKRYGAIIATLLIIIPNIVCVLTNLLLTPGTLWSVYVGATSAMIWFLFIFPFFLKTKYKLFIVAVDAVATAVYIFLFYYYNSPKTGWFLNLAIPLDIGVFLAIGFLIWFFGKKRTNIRSVIAVFTVCMFLNIYVCLIVNIYSYSVYVTYITTIIAVSCVIIIVFFCFADRNIKLRSWLSRKFFY